MTNSTRFIRVWPGCEMAVPDSDEHISAWVLAEQERWFESEMTMLPRLLEAGATFVDIGANIGVYSMAAAQIVGPRGRVVAFEPTEEARSSLLESIRRNGFDHVVVRPEALSDHVGTAKLFFDTDTELASLSPAKGGTSRSVTVPLTTLDAVNDELRLGEASLLKLDAEGAEEAILRGAKVFLGQNDPVILHEIKVGAEVNLRVAKILAELGFAPYRQIPGLDILVPFDLGKKPEAYHLNLFAVRPSRAAKLGARGVLAEKPGTIPAPRVDLGVERLMKFPYVRHLAARWQGTASEDKRLWTSLALHTYAHGDAQASAGERWAALEQAFVLAFERAEELSYPPRLLTLARISAELGHRSLAVRALDEAVYTMRRTGATNLYDEPFLLPERAFESVRPAGPVEGLVLYASLAAHERMRAFSSFFTGLEGLPHLRLAAMLGYSDPEMSRRLKLLERRAANVRR